MPTTSPSSTRTVLRQRHRLPAVRRVREVLRLEVNAMRFAGGVLPSEVQLAADYGVSRGVVREALDLLRDEGLITRLQGAGTFVVAPERSHHSIEVLQGLADGIERGHTRLSWRALALDRFVAPAFVASQLGLVDGSEVVHLERLTTLDGTPLMLRSSWFPLDVGAPLLDEDIDLTVSTYGLLDSLGVEPVSSELGVGATVADPSTAQTLQLSVGDPLLMLERLVTASDGRVVELGIGRACGNRFTLTTVLRRNGDDVVPRQADIDIRSSNLRPSRPIRPTLTRSTEGVRTP